MTRRGMVNPSPGSFPSRFDYVLVGGGLGNGLIALSLLHRRPGVRIAIVERERALCGNHTWSFHAEDVPDTARAFVDELVVRRWPAYLVRFPRLSRRVPDTYASVSSARFRDVLVRRMRDAKGCAVLTGVSARHVGADTVVLDGGVTLSGRVVIDGRGPARLETTVPVSYQKFVGVELEVGASDAEGLPTLMDATVPQTDGFRFFYTLPFARDRVLFEDTYYSDTPDLDERRVRAEVLDYARRCGHRPRGELRVEAGVLPLPHRPVVGVSQGPPLVSGFQGGWFHPTTGYSFPIAVRLAEHVAAFPPERLFGAELERFVAQHAKQFRFCSFLNRLLFGCFAPRDRWNVLERFYRLPSETVRRFYAMSLTRVDRGRILCGRPPRGFSLRYALAAGVTP